MCILFGKKINIQFAHFLFSKMNIDIIIVEKDDKANKPKVM